MATRKILMDLTKVNKENLLKSGVYCITNKANGNSYIGSTKNKIRDRLKDHCRLYERYKIN